MTKQILIDICVDRYGTTADRKKGYHPAIIESYIELAYNQVIYAIMKLAIHYSDYSQLDLFIRSFDNVKVLCDIPRNEWYLDIPCPIIQLPMGNGVRYITGIKDRKTNFHFRANGSSDVMENLEYSLINTIPSYYIENSKIYFDHRMTAGIASYGVLLKLIPTFSYWPDDQELPMPSADDLSILSMVETLINQKSKEDKQPDATPNDFGT